MGKETCDFREMVFFSGFALGSSCACIVVVVFLYLLSWSIFGFYLPVVPFIGTADFDAGFEEVEPEDAASPEE